MKQESVTRQNPALVEQATVATLSFEEEATRLTEAVVLSNRTRAQSSTCLPEPAVERCFYLALAARVSIPAARASSR